jgi:hypothetical protein
LIIVNQYIMITSDFADNFFGVQMVPDWHLEPMRARSSAGDPNVTPLNQQGYSNATIPV